MRPPPKHRLFPRLLAVHQLVVLAAAVMVLFGQSAAVGAVQSAGGAWVEVCAGSGTKLVQLGGETPANDCSHCEYCTVQFTAESAGAPTFNLIGPAYGFVPVRFVSDPAVFVIGSAHYWAANRGPPLTSEETMNTISALWAVMPPALDRGLL